mgnify:CR=1 FL=1
MEVMGLISFHWIFSLHDADSDDIDKINEIDSDDRHCGRDFSSCNDCKCGNKEGKDNRP